MTQSPKEEMPSSENKNLSANEYYDAIVGRIRELNGNEISDKDAHAAARNLIGFCQKVIEINSREIK